MNSTTANFLVIIAWAMTVYMAMNLLGGNFQDGRTCQSLCVNMLYWSALVVAVVGVILSLTQVFAGKAGWLSKIVLLLGLLLIMKLTGIMVIGTMTT